MHECRPALPLLATVSYLEQHRPVCIVRKQLHDTSPRPIQWVSLFICFGCFSKQNPAVPQRRGKKNRRKYTHPHHEMCHRNIWVFNFWFYHSSQANMSKTAFESLFASVCAKFNISVPTNTTSFPTPSNGTVTYSGTPLPSSVLTSGGGRAVGGPWLGLFWLYVTW
jgi:hypothetical protein